MDVDHMRAARRSLKEDGNLGASGGKRTMREAQKLLNNHVTLKGNQIPGILDHVSPLPLDSPTITIPSGPQLEMERTLRYIICTPLMDKCASAVPSDAR